MSSESETKFSQIYNDAEKTEAGIPWIKQEVQKRIKYRDGDIVLSVPAKSGTTWTMNIVHQIRSGGDREFEDVYEEVPWLEMIDEPGRKTEEIVERFDSMPTHRRRAFKTHSAPPDIPYIDPSEKDVKYVVVARNPEECIASMRPFLQKHSAEFLEMWGMPPNAFTFPDFQTFYDELVIEKGLYVIFFDFMAKWWPLREKENVLFMHYSEMKEDHDNSVKKIANFLGFEPAKEEWDTILEYTGYPWMKEHEHKFEATSIARIPPLERGGMIRKGQVHKAHEDGITLEISKDLAARGREILNDKDAFAWLYHGIPVGEGNRTKIQSLESWQEWL